MLNEAEPAVQHVRPLHELRRLPLPAARQVRRRGARRATGARAPERHAARRTPTVARLETNPAGTAVTEVVVERDGAPETFAADIVVVSCGAANTRQAAAARRPTTSTPTAWPTAPTRSAATTCSTTARRCSPSRQGAEPDRLPEDARPERLLLRERRLRLSHGQHPDGRQVAADMYRGEKPIETKLAPHVGARRHRQPRRRLLARPPRTCRGRTTGSRSTRDGTSGSATRRQPERQPSGSTTSSSRCSATWACTPTIWSRATRT